MIVQIYEIQTPEDAETMVGLGVDHVGSVVPWADRWKDPVLKATIQCVQDAGHKSSLIPLFGDQDLIGATIDYYRPDIIHFCETLPLAMDDYGIIDQLVQRQAYLRQQFAGVEIMRSIPIVINGAHTKIPTLDWADRFEPVSDWFLTDTLIIGEGEPTDSDQPVNGYVGITGKTCDWSMAHNLVQASRIPVILAGGIGPANVAAGIESVHPAGVDSCTLTNALDRAGEVIRFKKDRRKVKAMVAAARRSLNNKAKRDLQSAN